MFSIINSLRPRQNGRLFADDTFKRIFLNENIRISTRNSLKFVPKGLINKIPALVLIMAWRRPGDKPLSEPMVVSLPTHICVTRPQWVKACMCSFVNGWLTIDIVSSVTLNTSLQIEAPHSSAWWRHQMETFSALLALCAGNSPVNSPHKGQWRGSSMFSLICAWINVWVNSREAAHLRRHRAHNDVIAMV